MSLIEEQIVAQQIEHLDFEVVCKCWTRRVWLKGLITGRKKTCSNPAKWIGSLPCCSDHLLACDKCKNTPAHWLCCGKLLPHFMITWSKI